MLDLQNKIKGYMSDYRYLHTLSVAEECKRLASLFNIDEQNLVVAAYLHDITKEMSIEDQLMLCNEFDIVLDKSTLESPKTMHSFTAPLLIKKDFPEYADRSVLQAVEFHTTGRAGMTLIEKLLYLADYIEPTRKFEDCIALRNFFYSSEVDLFKRLNETLLLSWKYTISDLLKRNLPIHEQTVNAYNHMVRKGVDNG